MARDTEVSEVEERILTTATDLFASSGYSSVKVPEIAAEARVGLNTLYRYFPSKEALGNAVYRRSMTIWLEATMNRWPEDRSPLEQFEFYWSELCLYAEKHHTVAVYNEREPQGYEMDVASLALKKHVDRRVTEVLGAWVESKQVKDLPEEVLKALIHGTFQKILELPISKRKRRELFRHAGDAIWDSMAAPGKTAMPSADQGKRRLKSA